MDVKTDAKRRGNILPAGLPLVASTSRWLRKEVSTRRKTKSSLLRVLSLHPVEISQIARLLMHPPYSTYQNRLHHKQNLRLPVRKPLTASIMQTPGLAGSSTWRRETSLVRLDQDKA